MVVVVMRDHYNVNPAQYSSRFCQGCQVKLIRDKYADAFRTSQSVGWGAVKSELLRVDLGHVVHSEVRPQREQPSPHLCHSYNTSTLTNISSHTRFCDTWDYQGLENFPLRKCDDVNSEVIVPASAPMES
eukprot:1195428-Prorocentrum_minimum.AAC.3